MMSSQAWWTPSEHHARNPLNRKEWHCSLVWVFWFMFGFFGSWVVMTIQCICREWVLKWCARASQVFLPQFLETMLPFCSFAAGFLSLCDGNHGDHSRHLPEWNASPADRCTWKFAYPTQNSPWSWGRAQLRWWLGGWLEITTTGGQEQLVMVQDEKSLGLHVGTRGSRQKEVSNSGAQLWCMGLPHQ